MPHYSVKPLTVFLRTSRLLTLMLGGVSLGAGVLLLLLPFPVWLQTLLVLVVAAGAGHALWHHAWLRAPQSIHAIEVNAQGELHCHMPAHDWQSAQVLGSSTVTSWLTVLNLRVEGWRLVRHVVLLPDTADADALRQLRVWLRWGAVHE